MGPENCSDNSAIRSVCDQKFKFRHKKPLECPVQAKYFNTNPNHIQPPTKPVEIYSSSSGTQRNSDALSLRGCRIRNHEDTYSWYPYFDHKKIFSTRPIPLVYPNSENSDRKKKKKSADNTPFNNHLPQDLQDKLQQHKMKQVFRCDREATVQEAKALLKQLVLYHTIGNFETYMELSMLLLTTRCYNTTKVPPFKVIPIDLNFGLTIKPSIKKKFCAKPLAPHLRAPSKPSKTSTMIFATDELYTSIRENNGNRNPYDIKSMFNTSISLDFGTSAPTFGKTPEIKTKPIKPPTVAPILTLTSHLTQQHLKTSNHHHYYHMKTTSAHPDYSKSTPRNFKNSKETTGVSSTDLLHPGHLKATKDTTIVFSAPMLSYQHVKQPKDPPILVNAATNPKLIRNVRMAARGL